MFSRWGIDVTRLFVSVSYSVSLFMVVQASVSANGYGCAMTLGIDTRQLLVALFEPRLLPGYRLAESRHHFCLCFHICCKNGF